MFKTIEMKYYAIYRTLFFNTGSVLSKHNQKFIFSRKWH